MFKFSLPFIAVISLFTAVFFSVSANAASQYDNVYRTTDRLVVTSPNGKEYDVSKSWAGIVNGSAPISLITGKKDNSAGFQVQYKFNNQIIAVRSIDGLDVKNQSVWNQYTDLFRDKNSWSVSQQTTKQSSRNAVFFYSSLSPIEPLWTPNRLTARPHPSDAIAAAIFMSSNNIITVNISINSQPPYAISNDGVHNFHYDIKNFIFYSTADPNYPPGYAGERFRDSHIDKEPFNPKWTWEVRPSTDFNDLKGTLIARYDRNYPEFLGGDVYYELKKLEDSGTAQVLHTETKNPYQSSPLEYDLPGAGRYELGIGYTGDYPQGFSDKYSTFNSVIFYINWDGKSYISGNNHSDGESCVIDGLICGNDLGGPLGRADINTHNLQNVIAAPVIFLKELPSKVRNCEPISFKFCEYPNIFAVHV